MDTFKWQRYWKAIAGSLTPGAVVLISAVTGASEDGSTITTSEWITALAALVISGGAVYIAPPNDYSTPVKVEERSDPPVEEPPPVEPTEPTV